VQFGRQSIRVGNDTYAHPESAVIVAGENPLNKRFSTVAIAGLSGLATLKAAPRLGAKEQKDAEALLLPAGHPPRSLVLTQPGKKKQARTMK